MTDSSYSSKLLESAESLYAFAKAHQGTYNTDIPEGAKFYRYVPDDTEHSQV